MVFLTGIGQDSHRFTETKKPLILAAVEFKNHQGLEANSDGDVIIHSLINAISSITTKNILGKIADDMCINGITDSRKYLEIALQDLDYKINHIAITIECLTPKINHKIEKMRNSIATLVNIKTKNIGITATTGEGLSGYGKGLGIFATTIISVSKPD